MRVFHSFFGVNKKLWSLGNYLGIFKKKDWQLISDEATIYGSAEINQAKLSSKVEEYGSVIRRGCANSDSTVRNFK